MQNKYAEQSIVWILVVLLHYSCDELKVSCPTVCSYEEMCGTGESRDDEQTTISQYYAP